MSSCPSKWDATIARIAVELLFLAMPPFTQKHSPSRIPEECTIGKSSGKNA
jgi:hypothetical protein